MKFLGAVTAHLGKSLMLAEDPREEALRLSEEARRAVSQVRALIADEMARAQLEKRDPNPEIVQMVQQTQAALLKLKDSVDDPKVVDMVVSMSLAVGSMSESLKRWSPSTAIQSLPTPAASAPVATPPVEVEQLPAGLVGASAIIANANTLEQLEPALDLLKAAQEECCRGGDVTANFAEQALTLGQKLHDLGDTAKAAAAIKLALKPLYAVPGTAENIVALRRRVPSELQRLQGK